MAESVTPAIGAGDVVRCAYATQSLLPERDYFYLKSCNKSGRVHLVSFEVAVNAGNAKTESRITSDLRCMQRELFERLLSAGTIAKVRNKPALAPWFIDIEEGHLTHSDELRRAFVETHQDRIDSRVIAIWAAVTDIDKLLAAEDPVRRINEYARSAQPAQNSGRFRTWLFAYVIWGRIGLHYNLSRIGHWNRQELAELKKDFFSQVTPARWEQMLRAYQKWHGKAKTDGDLYVTAMRKEFGCRSRRLPGGSHELYHPNGEWFPSERVFYYQVKKKFDSTQRKQDKIGRNRTRSEFEPSKGSFTEHVVNVGEYVEYDPQFNSARAVSAVTGVEMSLTVGRLRDGACGAILGIGFDLGGETTEQFRAALFCCAIDKVKFAALFGLTIEPGEWPMQGLPLNIYMDRGPAAAELNKARSRREELPTIHLAPSYSGQSKAVVESSHDRTVDDNDGPHHRVSDLTVWNLVRNEILRAIRDNETQDVADRFPPDWVGRVDRTTPNVLYSKQVEVGRNDLRSLTFDQVVRLLLPKLPAAATRDGVALAGRPYRSKELQKTDFFRRIAAGQTISVEVHHLRACMAYVWLDYAGSLFELELVLQVSSGRNARLLSYSELLEDEACRRRHKTALEKHRKGVRAHVDELAEQNTGQRLDHSRRVAGTAKKTRMQASTKRTVRGKR